MATARTKKSVPAKKTKAAEAVVEETSVVEAVKEEVEEAPQKMVPTEIDPNMYITVINGFQGKLVYVSARTGETFVWNEFGGEQEIELRELRNVKNSAKTFFTANWFMFREEDDWVIDYLGVRQYYKAAINVDQFDEIFSKTPSEIAKIVSSLSDGQKKSISYLVRQKIANEEIDSIKTIRALEQALGVELVER